MPESQILVGAGGLHWHFREGEDDHLALGGHETQFLTLMKALLPDGGLFVDVGAHIGLWSLVMAQKGPVVALEANPATFDALVANYGLNEESLPHDVQMYQFAAWDGEARLRLTYIGDKETGGSVRVGESGDSELTVPAHPLDDIADLLEGVSMIKIDVEGAEARVLRGAHQILQKNKPTLFIEMHDEYLEDPRIREEVLAELESHEYVWEDGFQYGEAYYILAKDPYAGMEYPGEVVRAGDPA